MRNVWKIGDDESGTELVEFAITAMVLFTVLFAIIEFSLSMYTYHFVRRPRRRRAVCNCAWGGLVYGVLDFSAAQVYDRLLLRCVCG